MDNASITRDNRLAYIDFFKEDRDLAIRSPFHILVFDLALSPILQALDLEQVLLLHPTDALYRRRLWSCEDVADVFRLKRSLWEDTQSNSASPSPPGTIMLVVPPLDAIGQREAGMWETVFCRDE